MVSDVLDILRRKGPSLTSELIKVLQEEGLSASAARQRVTRAQFGYTKLAGLRFTKNTRFAYLDDQYGNKSFWDGLERVFRSHGQSYWGAVVGLRSRGGRCPKSLFPSVSGAPTGRKGQLSPDRILDRLKAIQLLEERTDEASGETQVRFHPHAYYVEFDAVANAVLLAEYVALHAIKDWARRLGLGSFGKFLIRGDYKPPVVSAVTWDLSAPSYMRPLVSMQAGSIKPGFVVCDINLRGAISEDAVALFVRKHDMASAPKGVAPILPILVADVFEQKAFDLARKSGILAATTAHLFGEETAKALRDLVELLTDTATAAVSADRLYAVITALTKIEGAANNIRGALFEMAIGNLAKDIEGGYLRLGEKKTDFATGRSAEIDVILDRPDGNPPLIIECKSKIPGAMVSEEEVRHWYEDRVPLIYSILSMDSHLAERPLRFELWSNGLFTAEAEAWLKAQATDFHWFTLGWKDGQALKDYAAKAKSASIRKVLNEHYFKHPLAKLSKTKASA